MPTQPSDTGVRRICVVTSSRADYGLLTPLLALLQRDAAFELQLVVTGTHLTPRFGETIHEIARDGFRIDARVVLPLDSDSSVATIRSMAAAFVGLGEAFSNLAPHIVILLGDRYETLAAAQAALLCGCIVAHVHGGEVTTGSMDDSFRHAITKLAHMHFVCAEEYRERVIRMGENPWAVVNVSALALDVISETEPVTRAELANAVGIAEDSAFFVVTYHPDTIDEARGVDELRQLLAALDRFPEYRLVITGHNADPGHRRFGELLSDYAANRPGRVSLHVSLGRRLYLGALRHASVVIGNSSSGIIEAPVLGVPSVNVGMRQAGRLRAPSVMDCAGTAQAIEACVHAALTPEFRNAAAAGRTPFGTRGAAARIVNVLKTSDLDRLRTKSFLIA